MCVSKPKVPKAPDIPDPAPPIEATAIDFKRDGGSKRSTASAAQKKGRKSASDLRVDLSIPGGGVGLQV